MTGYHRPVMLTEAVSYLSIKDNGIYVDATLGGGGHSAVILGANDTIRLYSFDRDEEAIKYNQSLVESYHGRFRIFNDNFVNIRTRLALERIAKVDGILFDLGVSFSQISTSTRGMSFDLEGKLDMRMNRQEELTAYDVVNNYSFEELAAIIRDYGEEKEAQRIANGIIKARQIRPIETTLDLSEIIDRSTRSPYKIKAKARVFQGIRIYINGELEALKSALYDAVEMLNPDGRVVVLSYHSLEDRIVKQTFINEEKTCICPTQFPKCICDKKKRLIIVTKKPLTPSLAEIADNRQARSAKMRVAQKVKDNSGDQK